MHRHSTGHSRPKIMAACMIAALLVGPTTQSSRKNRRNMIALLRLGVQLLRKRIDQSLIVRAYPEISIPGDRANLCWARSIVLLEHSELLSVPRRNKKFHCKGLSVSYRYESNSFMRGQFSGQSMSTRMDRHRSTLSESAFTAPLPSAEARSNGYGKRGEVVVRSGRRPLARMSIHNRVQFSASS